MLKSVMNFLKHLINEYFINFMNLGLYCRKHRK